MTATNLDISISPLKKEMRKTSALVLTLVAGLLVWIETVPVQSQIKPPNRDAPRTTAGGGTRFSPPEIDRPFVSQGTSTYSPGCTRGKTTLIALVPTTRRSRIGLTTEGRPTFFVYLPETPVQSAEFTLEAEDGKTLYKSAIPLLGQKGIVSFQLPADAPSLEVNQWYQWYFSLICNPNDRLRDLFVQAWVQRIEPSQPLVNALKKASPRQRPDIYAEARIWQDTLTSLTELRQTQPQDPTVIRDWNSVLKSVGLGQISGEPPTEQQQLKAKPSSPASK